VLVGGTTSVASVSALQTEVNSATRRALFCVGQVRGGGVEMLADQLGQVDADGLGQHLVGEALG
jgi:hypothetical protein